MYPAARVGRHGRDGFWASPVIGGVSIKHRFIYDCFYSIFIL